MSIAAFSHLKEIQSLDNMIKKHLDAISAEEGRLEHINALRKRAQDEIENLTNLVSQKKVTTQNLEKELFDWENKLAKAEENLPYATNEKEVSALERDRSMSQENVDDLQEKVLTLLEEIEEHENLIREKEVFLSGSQETLDEINLEIEIETRQERQQITNYEARIEVLRQEVPGSLWQTFSEARKKHRFNLPLARIMNKACEKCRFIVDAQTASRVEAATGYELCTQCGRLLIPLES